MKNTKIQILITGGFGYVGSKLCNFLSQRNYEISIIDNLLHKNYNKKIINKNVKFYNIDINNHNKLIDHFKKNQYEVVIHLAAIVGDPASKKFPKLTNITNLVSSKKLFNLCVRNKIKKFIFFFYLQQLWIKYLKEPLNRKLSIKTIIHLCKNKS